MIAPYFRVSNTKLVKFIQFHILIILRFLIVFLQSFLEFIMFHES